MAKSAKKKTKTAKVRDLKVKKDPKGGVRKAGGKQQEY